MDPCDMVLVWCHVSPANVFCILGAVLLRGSDAGQVSLRPLCEA